jgi:hypothetical protein
MLPAFDEAPLNEPVEDADQSDRLDLEKLGQSPLMDAFVLREIGDGLPLRTRHAEVASLLLESLPHEAVDLMNQKS